MRRPLMIGAALLVALTATAQDSRVENYRPKGRITAPNWIYPHQFNVRLLDGGRNTAGEAQLYACSRAELAARKGGCATLPRDRKLDYGTPVRITGEPGDPGVVWLGADGGWTPRSRAFAKTTQGLLRARYVKQSPGQGAMISLEGVNAAQGDMMGIALDLRDPIGGQAGGDEGLMPLAIYMRDHDAVGKGSSLQRLKPGSDRFLTHPTSGKPQHDDQAGGRRLLIWHDGPRIPFRLMKQGHNPKPNPPKGGATWKLEAPLAFPDGRLPATASDTFAHERTDWCATLDATAYQLEGTQYNYVLVSRFQGSRMFTTHRIAQGSNAGVYENGYVRGFRAVDHAVDAGHGAGHLIPCSLVTGYDGVKQEFAIAPVIDSAIPDGSSYSIPSMGTMGPEGIKVSYDFKLGTGGARTGILVNTLPGPDNRMGDRAFVSAGHWREAFTSFDAEVMLHDFHPRHPKDAYVLAQLRGSSTWKGHEIEVWYPEPKDRGRASVELPHVPGNSAFVLVERGNGPPESKCHEPGLQRYYDLSTDRDYICASTGKWKAH